MTYTQTNSNTGTLKFYGEVSRYWNDGDDFTRTFNEMEKKFSNIDIRLHSYGGSVLEGTVIFNAIKRSKANVTVYIDGVAASMASIIMLAAKKIVIAENAFIMIHVPSAAVEGSAQTLTDSAQLLKSMEKNFIKAYARKTRNTESEASALMDGRDHWFSAEEAKEMGLVDEIGDSVVENIQDIGKPDADGKVLQLFDKYAALFSPVNEIPTNKTSTMKKDLIKQFNLDVDESASDTDVLAAMEKKFSGVQNSLKALQEEQKQQHTDQVNALIATAEGLRGNPFDAKIKEQLVAIGEKAGIEALSAALRINPVQENTQQQAAAAPAIVNMISGKNTSTDPHAGWNWDKYQEEDPDALEALEKNDWNRFNALYKAKYKTDAPK